MEILELISDKIGILLMVVIGVIALVAIIRLLFRKVSGDSIKVLPVGVMNDLPSSVTGLNKYDDMSVRDMERRDKRTE